MQEVEHNFDFSLLVDRCVAWIADGLDYADYDARVKRGLDVLLPFLDRDRSDDDPMVRQALARHLARAIWRMTPHPARHFAPGVLPVPKRNDACHCGSRRKYKQCCLPMEQQLTLPEINFLGTLLEYLPKKRWPELVGSRVDVGLVANTAHEWLEGGRNLEAMQLLEPWFKDDTHFSARYEPLFDMLLDAYLQRHHPRKKARLLERAEQRGDRKIRSAALQRRVSMLADAGDFDAAWALFEKAQRHEPDSASLSHLEITVLYSQGREQEARERAQFWKRKLERRRDPDLGHLVALMDGFARHGEGALLRLVADRDPGVASFLDAWAAAPPIQSHYRLEPDVESAGPLQPSRALRDALGAFSEVFPTRFSSPLDDALDELWDNAWQWAPVLQERPILLNSFEVLDGLQDGLEDLDYPGVDSLRAAVVERGVGLLREVLRHNQAEGLKLEWGWLENRSALRLLGARIAQDMDDSPTAEHMELLEWLVRELNPGDNQGFRELLLHRYIELERFGDAIDLAELYPGDFAGTQYGHALALFAAGRRQDADETLATAVEQWPNTLAWLLKRNARMPPAGQYGVVVGGDEEAWLYRQAWLDLWRAHGALKWARQFALARS